MATDAQIGAIDARLNGHGRLIAEEAQRAGLELALACALVEQESGGRNIFGCDHGPVGDRPPYCNQECTEARVDALRRSPHMNGVGLTQLTWWEFVENAERMGGAHRPVYQLREGFRILADLLSRYEYHGAIGAYNAGEANRHSVRWGYTAQVEAKHAAWKQLLGSGAEPKEDRVTRFRTALEYLKPAIGRTKYVWWTSGPVPEGSPAWAVNRPAPKIEDVIRGGVFCAGVPNLMLRRVGKRVPTHGNELFDGGTLAYWEYFKDYSEPFDLATAKRWAREAKDGAVLVGRRFVSSADQGHVALVLKSGYVLQSFDGGGGWPGLNWDHTIEASHNGWFYQWMCHSRNWINYHDPADEF